MLDILSQVSGILGTDTRTLLLFGLFGGSLILLLGLSAFVRGTEADRISRRMGGEAALSPRPDLLSHKERDPSGIAKAFSPTNKRERSQIQRDLAQAGFAGPNAVLVYYGLRIGLGLVFPGLFALIVLFHDMLPFPLSLKATIGQLVGTQLLILFAAAILLGFYGPAVWLKGRSADRRQRVEMAFPNALDLLQVSIEAGIGFDAALSRVAEEMANACPEISTELVSAQQEILAGRNREEAYRGMADRLGIDEAYAFINVVLQSRRFGTSMSQALLAYSADMRQRREIRAQEKANKLPVYMSGVMAALMMPSLLIVTVGPVVIRYLNTF